MNAGASIGLPRLTADAAAWAPYAALAAGAQRELKYHGIVPAEHGLAFPVMAGEILRITCNEGPQTCDFNAFALDDPAEHFWSGRTRTLEGSHLTVGNRLWGTEPRMRPIFTIIADTVSRAVLPCNAASHDLVFSRCSHSAWVLRLGPGPHRNCNDNLTEALADAGFPGAPVHDAFNIFMTTGIDDDKRLRIFDPLARVGDYMELVAEIDTMVALSACPGDCNGGRNKALEVHVHGAAKLDTLDP
jgi:uncharacterized protein